MLNLRQFTKSASGMFMASCAIASAHRQARAHRHGAGCGPLASGAAWPQAAAASDAIQDAPAVGRGSSGPATAPRRVTTIGGKRIRTVDVHAHVILADALDVVKGTPLEKSVVRWLKSRLAKPIDEKRIEDLDAWGIDVSAMSINALWYGADLDTASRLCDVQNRKLAELCASAPDRFVGFATVALQFPELAAKQLEYAVKTLGLCGAGIACSVEGEEIADARFDPFWAKAEELQALVFIHPQSDSQGVRTKRIEGSGALRNVIGNPLDTTYALSHLIFEGTFDKFPDVKICAAHGGGFLPSYPSRMDHGRKVFPKDFEGHRVLKKKPSEYLRQLYVDTLVFTPENLRHLVAVCGASQLMIGTDYPIPWVEDPVSHVLETPELSDAERIAILGGTAEKLLHLT